MDQISIFGEDIDPKVEIDADQTSKRAKYVLDLYKKCLYRQANVASEPNVTSQITMTPPTFSSGGSDKIGRELEIQEKARDIINSIFDAINDMYVSTNVPTPYYRQLLYYRFLDFKMQSVIDVRQALAKDFSRRIECDYNDVMLDEHVYYRDQKRALVAFAQVFKCDHAEEEVVVYKKMM